MRQCAKRELEASCRRRLEQVLTESRKSAAFKSLMTTWKLLER